MLAFAGPKIPQFYIQIINNNIGDYIMFGLVYENKIQVGPREWSYVFFKDYLIKNNLTYNQLPKQSNNSVITDQWQILKVKELNIPNYDQLFEQLAGPYWTIHQDHITGYYDIMPVPLNSIKNTLKSIVAANRYQVEIAGIDFDLDGTKVGVYTDRENRSVYLDALMIMADDELINFKFKNGIFKQVSKSQLTEIVKAGASHIKSAFDWEAEKITAIDSANSVDELKNIELIHLK